MVLRQIQALALRDMKDAQFGVPLQRQLRRPIERAVAPAAQVGSQENSFGWKRWPVLICHGSPVAQLIWRIGAEVKLKTGAPIFLNCHFGS